jgi:hypothetical protein
MEKENLLRKLNDMTADIEKLIHHNEELLIIKNEIKSRGMIINNNRFFNNNSNTNHSSSKTNMLESEQPKPIQFVSK